VKLAFEAFSRARTAASKPLGRIAGLSDDQLFFVAYGQVWCEVATDERARLMALTDAHSPGRYRVQGPRSNLLQFAAAFSCKDGDAMTRANACEVW
jgi:putative endopeptidase